MRERTPRRAPAAVAAALVLALVAAEARTTERRQDRPTGAPADAAQLETLKAEGEIVYQRDCASCHGADGQGDGAGPPLAGNPNLADADRVIARILEGVIDRGMEPFGRSLSDRQVAAVATFIRNGWENAHGLVLETAVTAARDRKQRPPT